MPLLQVIEHSPTVSIYVWKVEESLEELLDKIVLRPETKLRLTGMKSEVHQRGFAAIRRLLEVAGYTDYDLLYDEEGKPYLKDGRYISISHSFEYATIVIGSESVGIDVEKVREKIVRIAEKFCNEEELVEVDTSEDAVFTLTRIWCAKEAMYKMCDSRSLSFKDHMRVYADGISQVSDGIFENKFSYYTVNLQGFVMVFALESRK